MTNSERNSLSWFKGLKWLTVRNVAVALGLIGIFVAVGGSIYDQNTLREALEEFYSNASWELISIAITVLIIDTLYQRRQEEQLKAQLIREMDSKDKGIAQWAVNELRAHGWLMDESLRGKIFFGANLEGADLRRADLQKVSLLYVNLRGANLQESNLQEATLALTDLHRARLNDANLQDAKLLQANLQEASLFGAKLLRASLLGTNLNKADMTFTNLLGARDLNEQQLAETITLFGATMPDGSRYDGRFNLQRDIVEAHSHVKDTNNTKAMANFYDVSLEEYLSGQDWARENLSKFREDVDYVEDASAITHEREEEQSLPTISYYVFENWSVRPKKSRVHIADCIWCNHGKGIHAEASGRNSRWHGPFDTLEKALAVAEDTGNPVTVCKKCNPS